jgi:lipoic acid synthetase
MAKLPSWFKQEIPGQEALNLIHLFSEFGVNTVCRHAKCPNISRCFANKKATFMILGDTCTRNCRFCSVKKSEGAFAVDPDEPYRIRKIAETLGVDYCVVTSVTRDDLEDGGAGQFARTIELVQESNIKIEVLIPDFQGNTACLETVLNAGPVVCAHNLETVRRLYPDLRQGAGYGRSLELIRKAKELKPQVFTKSSLMLGLGETEQEVIAAMEDLRKNNCDSMTLGQYLAPSPGHYPVKGFITLEQFKFYEEAGLSLGFKAVLSGPNVRSSYIADELFKELTYA